MMDGGNMQASCGDLSSNVESNGVKVSSPTKVSPDGSSFGSGKSGLAILGDGVAGQTCEASSESSAQSDRSLKAHDYIGLSEVSSRAVRAEQSALQEDKQEMVAGENLKLGLQETELRLGLPQPAAASVEVLVPLKPKQPYASSSMEGKEAELLSAPFGQPLGMEGPTSHPSFLNGIKHCENDEKVIAPVTYSKEQGDGAMQNVFGRNESFKRRYAGNNVHVWDLGVSLTPQITAYPQEEVGENKLSSGTAGGRALKISTADSPEYPSKTQEKSQPVLAFLESAGDEHKSLTPKSTGHLQQDMELARQKQLLKGSSLPPSEYGHFNHEPQRSPHLQELSVGHKFWQAQMTPRAADGLHLPRSYELQSPQFSQDLETSKAGYGRALNGFTEARVLPVTARNTMAGVKRGFSEAIGGDEVALNGTKKVANSVTADPESKENLQLKHQLALPRFAWNSTKQSLVSWPPGLERPAGAAPFGPFTPPGPNLMKGDTTIPPREAHLEGLPGEPTAISKKPQVEAGHGQQDAQNTAEDDKIATPPRAPVGWPPVQSFRKNSLPPPKPKKPIDTEARPSVVASPSVTPVSMPSECLFVKVYMDGLPIGRKVDLRFYNNYEKLSLALEDMFQGFFSGQYGTKGAEDASSSKGKKLNLLRCSDYVITYEDKDGDLMLVGDVPWGMFLSTVKRLRIMKGSEAIGLAPGSSDKIKCS